VTDLFLEGGHLLLAAETATFAQRPRAAGLRQECQGARTPLLESAAILAHRLTPREREIAALAVTMTSQEIAGRLGLSVNTVNNNLARAFTKLDVHNRRELRAILGDG
jgi:DNA-binding CsgD family transcriptional regulator